LFHFF